MLVRTLMLTLLQMDEIYTRIRTTASAACLWLAVEPKTKLILSYLLASRKSSDATPFVHRLRNRLAIGHIPVFLSDGLRQSHALLTAHFGAWMDGTWVVSPHLHLAQTVKILRPRRLTATSPGRSAILFRHVRLHRRA